MQYYLLKSYARCVKINNEKSKKEPFLMKTVSLKTEYETLLCGCETPFSDYPRPQLRRDVLTACGIFRSKTAITRACRSITAKFWCPSCPKAVFQALCAR